MFFLIGNQQNSAFTQNVLFMLVILCLIGIIIFLIWRVSSLIEALRQAQAAATEAKQSERQIRSNLQTSQTERNELMMRQKLTDRLITLSRATSGMSTLNDTLKNILRVSSLLTNAEIGSLLLIDAGRKVVDSFSSYKGNMPNRGQEAMEHVLDEGLAGWVVRNSETTLIKDTNNDPRWINLPDASYQAGSVLCVPISQGATIIGVLTLIHSKVNYFNEEDVELMESAAEQMAQALGNAQIFEGQRRVLERQTTLSELLQAVSQQVQPLEVAKAAAETMVRLAGWDMVAIYMLDEHGGDLLEYATAGTILPKRPPNTPIKQEETLVHVWRTKQYENIKNIARSYDHVPAHPQLQSELYLPMIQGQRAIGVLNLGMIEPYAFPPEDVVLAESMAEATALAIVNAQYFNAVAAAHGRLDAVIENNAGNSIIMVGLNKRILVINQAAIESLRLGDTQEDWQGRTIYNVVEKLEQFAPEAAISLSSEADRIRVGDEEATEGEIEIAPYMMQWSNLPVMVEEQPRGRLYIWRDATEEWAVERMRDDLISTMVHDLRNPLHMIASGIGFLTEVLVSDYNVGANEQEVLNIAMVNTERMIGLVNAILDINQLESGRLPLNYIPFQTSESVNHIYRLLEPRAQEKNITLSVASTNDNLQAWADKAIIERVLENLIGNALKFTPRGGQISVYSEPIPDKQRIKISVCDTGPGVDPEVLPKIFEKFTSGKANGMKGNGLGLAFCKMALDAHRQRIWVEKSDETGTIFSFTLAIPQDE